MNTNETHTEPHNENGEAVSDLSGLHKCRTELPNILFDIALDIHEFRLYCQYKKVAGDESSCWMSTKSLIAATQMSERGFWAAKKNLEKPRAELGGLSLITIKKRYKTGSKERGTDLIVINDIWGLNFQRIYSKSSRPPAPHAPPPPCKTAGTPPAKLQGKEDPPKKVFLRETPVATSSKSLPPPAASAFVSAFYERLKKKNPGHKKPNLHKWALEVDKMIRLDGRSYEDAEAILAWADDQADGFWPTALLGPKSLRSMFDRALIKMRHKSKAQQEQSVEQQKEQLLKANRSWAQFLRKNIFPNENLCMRVNEYSVGIHVGNARAEVGYAEPQFKEIILNKLKNWGITPAASQQMARAN